MQDLYIGDIGDFGKHQKWISPGFTPMCYAMAEKWHGMCEMVEYNK